MKIFLLKLHWHEISGSARWFVELLNNFATVEEIEIDTDLSCCYDIIKSKPDMVICWQAEYLVPWFLARGIASVAVPMADGCSNMGNIYYKIIGQSGSISVSNFIVDKFISNKIPTYKLKYYPSVSSLNELHNSCYETRERKIKVFYGYRSKNHIKANSTARILRNHYCQKFHMHLQMDDYYEQPIFENFDSFYFRDPKDLNMLLLESDFFLCSRDSKGIGMSVIRAISLGCIPIGVSGPGNTEYFQSPHLGFSISESILQSQEYKYASYFAEIIKDIDLPQVRQNLYYSFVQGRKNYEKQCNGLEVYIKTLLNRFTYNKRSFILRNAIFLSIPPHLVYKCFVPLRAQKNKIFRKFHNKKYKALPS